MKENSYVLSSLIRTCKLKYRRIATRLPIRKGLLHMIIDEIERIFLNRNQPYLATLYTAMMITGYYGLLRIGELTVSPHTIKAKDVHLATNKSKVLICLKTSKTHTKANKPQIIKMEPILKNSKTCHL